MQDERVWRLLVFDRMRKRWRNPLKFHCRTGTIMTKFSVSFIGLALGLFAGTSVSSAQIEVIPGSSTHGAEVFRKNGCIDCHAFGSVGGTTAPDLRRSNERPRTPIQLATTLWNHGPRMWRAQDARGIRPSLDSMDAADLFAYFYSLSYFNSPGNATRGPVSLEQKVAQTVMKLPFPRFLGTVRGARDRPFPRGRMS